MENVNNIVEIKENTTLLLTNPTSYNFIVNEGVKLELRLAIFDVKNNIDIKRLLKLNDNAVKKLILVFLDLLFLFQF